MHSNAVFESQLEEYLQRAQLSCSLQIAKGTEILYRKDFGYANREKKILIDDNTRFRFYSLTKPFTAIAIMQLYEKGLLKLDDAVCKLLPIAAGLPEQVKVIHLLQHTSGLAETSTHSKLSQRGAVCYEEELKWLSEQKLEYAPGCGETYCNTNYLLLSLIVEELSGMCLREYFQKNIFDVFGMKTASLELGDCIIPNLAVGYDMEEGKLHPAGYVNMEIMYGAGCMVGRVADVDCLYRAIRERAFLKGSTWDLIFTKSNVGGFGFGCGVFTQSGYLCYQNNGGHLGFRTLHRYLPEIDFDIILLSNAGFGNIRGDVCDMIFEHFLTRPREAQVFEMDKGFV